MDENENEEITIDIEKLYKLDPDRMEIDIDHVHYSNVAYVQVQPRDVQLDLLQMPGIPEEGKNKVKTTRVYLTHATAKKLAETILSTLDIASKNTDPGSIQD